ncbi:tol-pal system protein YbgF [Shewanella yunxiaonensis]|uniref:Cell division coordinator CpoB n=1 Tax=Shewanella yunxiaonensis TaxID=2829809 RepID=A0ABX7YX13_9GAMM|nr:MULTISPECIES: tol-pal system protein YbgF [Shewanella]MDF0535437.1 tol-pal system protein YbgF [Shewanella sp. A32]QUN07353.1 tol-pal system protein YbgF [Shewanella yunxiaonensis]
MKIRLIAAATLLLPFCAATAATPAPVQDLGTGVTGSDSDRIARLERIIKARQEAEIDMQRRLDALQQEVLDLHGTTEQQNYQINQMLQRQRQLYDEISKLSSQQTSNVANAVPAQPAAASSGSSLSETDSYQRAVDLVLKARQYDAAIPAFKEFISQYPNSGFADNANYWLGQLLYNKGDYVQAKTAFENVVNNFKASDKRPDSLVKLGLIAEKNNDKATAKSRYQQVVKEYANSAAASIAKQQLAAIKP